MWLSRSIISLLAVFLCVETANWKLAGGLFILEYCHNLGIVQYFNCRKTAVIKMGISCASVVNEGLFNLVQGQLNSSTEWSSIVLILFYSFGAVNGMHDWTKVPLLRKAPAHYRARFSCTRPQASLQALRLVVSLAWPNRIVSYGQPVGTHEDVPAVEKFFHCFILLVLQLLVACLWSRWRDSFA